MRFPRHWQPLGGSSFPPPDGEIHNIVGDRGIDSPYKILSEICISDRLFPDNLKMAKEHLQLERFTFPNKYIFVLPSTIVTKELEYISLSIRCGRSRLLTGNRRMSLKKTRTSLRKLLAISEQQQFENSSPFWNSQPTFLPHV